MSSWRFLSWVFENVIYAVLAGVVIGGATWVMFFINPESITITQNELPLVVGVVFALGAFTGLLFAGVTD